jgi:hypothetical protein
MRFDFGFLKFLPAVPVVFRPTLFGRISHGLAAPALYSSRESVPCRVPIVLRLPFVFTNSAPAPEGGSQRESRHGLAARP